jgi:hypothetical protein
MKTITELTKEELELVQAAREKKEQERLEEEKWNNDTILLKKQTVMKQMIEGEKQVKAAKEFFRGFTSPQFELVEEPNKQILKCYSRDRKSIIHEEPYQINRAFIRHKSTGKIITISEHIVAERWSHKNKGYKMFCNTLSNRAYSNPITVQSSLLNIVDSNILKYNRTKIRETFITELIETQPIPNAIIEKEYILSDYVESKNGVIIKYNNGVKATCSIDIKNDVASLSIYKTEYPKPKIEGETIMDKLKYISELKF